MHWHHFLIRRQPFRHFLGSFHCKNFLFHCSFLSDQAKKLMFKSLQAKLSIEVLP